MRNIDRDRRRVFWASYEDKVAQVDEHGLLTGDWVVKYGEPREAWPTVTIGHGYAWHYPYGLRIDYDRVVRLDDPDWEVSEEDVMWIDRFWPSDRADGGWFDQSSPYTSGIDADGGDFGETDASASIDGGEWAALPTAPHDYIVKKVGRGKGYTILYVDRVAS